MILCFARQRVYVVGLELLGKEIFSTKKCVHNYFYNYACWRISRIVRLKKKKKATSTQGRKSCHPISWRLLTFIVVFYKKKNRVDPAAKPKGTVSGRNRSRCLLTKSSQRQSDWVASSPGRGQLHLAILDCQLLTQMFFIF